MKTCRALYDGKIHNIPPSNCSARGQELGQDAKSLEKRAEENFNEIIGLMIK
tara:strand:+ start:335 stop:490 length:156 start_codon:yes stop_codon:yes gene_type:complete